MKSSYTTLPTHDNVTEEISQSYYHKLQQGAENHQIKFNITKQYLWKLFIIQKRQCALSGIPIRIQSTTDLSVISTATLNRIDADRGYVEGNIQWVHKYITHMKLNISQDIFIKFCNLVTNHNKGVPRISVTAKVQIEGIHRWLMCPIPEVSYLQNLHRHIFHIEARAPVSHKDRDIEFIQLSHDIKTYLTEKYYSDQYRCLFFNDRSCEMIGDELVNQFKLYECHVTEDLEGGAIVRRI